MRFKILAIDLHLTGSNVTNASFYDELSFSDYDAIVLDPISISKKWGRIPPGEDGSLLIYSSSDGGFSKALALIMTKRAEETKLLLENTGGMVVCFLRQKGSVLNYESGRYIRSIHHYSWLPRKEYRYWKEIGGSPRRVERQYTFSSEYFDPVPRFGHEIGEINRVHPFSQYLMTFAKEIHFEAVVNSAGLLEVAKPIAKSRVGEVVALELAFGQGRFIFLPPPMKHVDRERISDILVDCIRNSFGWAEPLIKPKWVNKYQLPGELDVLKELEETQGQIAILEKAKRKIEERRDRLEMLKGMLYEQGKYGLEPPVREAFRILGFNVLQPDQYEEDYDLYAKEPDSIIIGEIEGSHKQVDVWKYRQLLDYVSTKVEEGANVKGILIGNGLVDEPPDKRTEQFTEKAILGCRKQKFCRITTYALFKAVCATMSAPNSKKLKGSIKRKILKCDDEFKFS